MGTLLLAAAILFTFSRGSWLAVLVSIGVYLKLRGTRYLLVFPLVLCILMMVLLTLSGSTDIFIERIQNAYDQYLLNFASTTRGQSFGYVAAISAEHPLLGLGTGMYRFEVYDLRNKLNIPTPLGVLDTPDNMFLIWLAENGTLGLCAALVVMAGLLRYLWQRAAEEGVNWVTRERLWAFIAAFTGFYVNMLSCSALYFPVTRIVFWIMAGMAVATLVHGEKESLERE